MSNYKYKRDFTKTCNPSKRFNTKFSENGNNNTKFKQSSNFRKSSVGFNRNITDENFDPEYVKLVNLFPSSRLFFARPYDVEKLMNMPNLFGFVLPKGKPCSIWFHYFNNQFVSHLVSRNERKHQVFRPVTSCFNYNIGYGTVIDGILVEQEDGTECFVMTYIQFLCASKYGDTYPYFMHIVKLSELFDKLALGNIFNDNNSLKFALPCVKKIKFNHESIPYIDIDKNIVDDFAFAPYSVRVCTDVSKFPIGDISFSKLYGNQINDIDTVKHFVLKVIPSHLPDIYDLWGMQEGELVKIVQIAPKKIADSIRLNGIFRNIRENDDIDLIEESEDEDLYEDESLDKYIIRSFAMMNCTYNLLSGEWNIESIHEDQNYVSSVEIDRLDVKYQGKGKKNVKGKVNVGTRPYRHVVIDGRIRQSVREPMQFHKSRMSVKDKLSLYSV